MTESTSRKVGMTLCAAVAINTCCGLAHGETISENEWSAFLRDQDMVWPQLPSGWNDAPFVGNGKLGTIFWLNQAGKLHFEISRGDLYDHRRPDRQYTSLHTQCRLPNGHFELAFEGGKPTGGMRMDLWNAEVRGDLATAAGKWNVRTLAHANMDVILLEITTSVGAVMPELTWHPDEAKTTRRDPPKEYKPYPAQERHTVDGIICSIQQMPESAEYRTDGLGAAQYATAWAPIIQEKGRVIYAISLAYVCPGTDAGDIAINTVKKARTIKPDELTATHQKWWHDFYGKSFLSIPDGALESFYWIQMYKMGSLSRKGGPIIDLMGPWYSSTTWPAIWWNLNIQLTYWPYYMANHLEEAEPLADTLWQNRAMLAQNAAPYQADSIAIGRATAPTCEGRVGGEVGNMPWVMHNLWMHYRSTMDDAFLRDKLFPLMKSSFNYLRHIAKETPDGKLMLANTASPEYVDKVDNSSYTLACFRWLASTIIAADERLKLNDPIVTQCRDVLARLTPYEVDAATGIMIGKNTKLEKSHRHWSHLFMIYPFYEWDWADANRRPLMQQSLDHWTSMPEAFAGYSWLGAASMWAAAGDGEKAVTYLRTFLEKSPLPNTLYREGSPVIETPLACARTIQELLMTSQGDCIRIFPAVPKEWKDASFADLRAEGAFLVSAQWRNGATAWIKITSLAGEPCRVRTGLKGEVQAHGPRAMRVTDCGGGVIEIDVAKGETVVLSTGSAPAETKVMRASAPGEVGRWGAGKTRAKK